MAAIPTPTPSDCAGLFSCGAKNLQQAADAVGGAINGAVQTVDFWTDPWGNTFKSLQAAAHGLAESVLPTVTKATLPDLNADWFLKAYAVAFALAIFIAVVLLLPQVVRTARGLQGGRELVESVGIYFPLFLISAMFGPPFGVLLVNFFQSISDSIIRWGVTDSAATVTSKFQAMLTADDAAGIAGGAPVGVLLMLLLLTGLLLVIVMLVVQLVTLYFTGTLLPLGLVWIIDPTRRRFGAKIATIWLGILASHPLLFFLLAIAYLMVSSSVDAFGADASLASTVQLIVSVLALFLAGLSPFVLMKLAPVLPSGGGATSGPSLTGVPIGAQNMTEADDRYGSTPPQTSPGQTQPTAPASSDTSVDEPTPATGPSTIAGVGSSGGASESSSDRSEQQPVPAGAAPAAPGAVGGASASRGEPSVVVAPAGAPGAPPPAAAGVTGAAGSAGEAAVAVGAEESATGVGAAIGVPTMLAGVAVKGAELAQSTTETVGAHATAALDDFEDGGNRNG